MHQDDSLRDGERAVLKKLKDDWNARAAADPQFYIASSCEKDEAAFRASGRRDVNILFGGIEHLLTKNAVVLDIGCGLGRMDEFIAPRVARLIGIDVAGGMVEGARSRLAHLSNAVFIEGDGYSLRPIESKSIDVVFSNICFQHCPAEVMQSYFGEVTRVMKPTGHFIFQVPEAPTTGVIEVPAHDNSWDLRFYSDADLRRRLGSLGFVDLGFTRMLIDTPNLNFNQLRVVARLAAASSVYSGLEAAGS